jgi:hypothetical protein
VTPTIEAAPRYIAALKRLEEVNQEAQALAEVLDYFAGVLRGGRPDPDGPPLEALPSSWRVKRVLERRAETEDEVEEEWGRLPGEARAAAPSPDDLLGGRLTGPPSSL